MMDDEWFRFSIFPLLLSEVLMALTNSSMSPNNSSCYMPCFDLGGGVTFLFQETVFFTSMHNDLSARSNYSVV